MPQEKMATIFNVLCIEYLCLCLNIHLSRYKDLYIYLLFFLTLAEVARTPVCAVHTRYETSMEQNRDLLIFLFLLLFFLSQTLLHYNLVSIVDTTVTPAQTNYTYSIASFTTQRSIAKPNQYSKSRLGI